MPRGLPRGDSRADVFGMDVDISLSEKVAERFGCVNPDLSGMDTF